MNFESWNKLDHQILDYKLITLAHCHFEWSICTSFFITVSKVKVKLRIRL